MSQIGVEARHKRRLQEIERVKALAENLFWNCFPPGTSNINQVQFNTQWQQYLNDITQKFGQFKDHTIAYNDALYRIKALKIQYGWNITIPTVIVKHKPRPQLRQLSWLQVAGQVHTFYQDWFEQVKQHSPYSKEEAYRNVVLSFLFHSGHCENHLILAFNQQLSLSSLPLQCWDSTPFIYLTVSTNKLNTNVDNDGDKSTQCCCYLHPLTQGLIRIWQHWKKEDWSLPQTGDAIMQCLTQYRTQLTWSQFLSGVMYVVEDHQGVELNQALVEYKLGRTPSYSLPIDNLTRLVDPGVSQLIEYASSSPPQSTPIHHQKTKKLTPSTFEQIKECFATTNAHKLAKSECRRRLKALLTTLQQSRYHNEAILVDWFIHKLAQCSVSSLRAYHSRLTRQWLTLCAHNDLTTLNSDELELLYQSAIDVQTTEKNKHYFAGRLFDLHAFAVTHYQLAGITSNAQHQNPINKHTRAGFIDEGLFRALLARIGGLTEVSSANKLTLQCICIISYRCGLRLTELIKLKVRDIEGSKMGWISIKDNDIANNKTSSSLRKVPLHPMLLSDEAKLIDTFLTQTINTKPKQQVLFSLSSDAKLPMNSLYLSTLIGQQLKSLSQLSFFVFHHLRHSCLSRLQLIIEMEPDEPVHPNMMAYDSTQREKIKYHICGQSKRNRYDAIAAFAGHESASMTFAYYFHFSDWIVAQKINQAKFALTHQQQCRLGLTARRKKTTSTSLSSDYLLKKLHVTALTNTITLKTSAPTDIPSVTETISIQLCYHALSMIQEGRTIEDVHYQTRIPIKTINKWIDNAKKIKSIEVHSQGEAYSRHFTLSRSHKLLPATLNSLNEVNQVDEYIKHLSLVYVNNKVKINNLITYVLQHTSVSRSGIYFQSPNELAIFLDTVHLFIPNSHWRAMTHYIDTSVRKEQWQEVLKPLRCKKERKKTGKGKKSQGSVRLELVHPHQRNDPKHRTKQSSPALQYLFHMMGIMMMK